MRLLQGGCLMQFWTPRGLIHLSGGISTWHCMCFLKMLDLYRVVYLLQPHYKEKVLRFREPTEVHLESPQLISTVSTLLEASPKPAVGANSRGIKEKDAKEKKPVHARNRTLEELMNRGTVSEDGVTELSRVSTVEKTMAPHSSTLAWKIPWEEEPGRLQSMGLWRVGHDWATSLSLFTFRALKKEMATHSSVVAWRIPRTGAWWAVVYGVAQSWTRLTWLSSSSSTVETGLPGLLVSSSYWLLPGLLKTKDRGFLSRGAASELSLSLEAPGAPEGGGKESYREQKY